MNTYALLAGITLILIPNALFALWMLWYELNGNGSITRCGRAYINGTFGLIAIVLVTALMGIVGYIETAGI